MERQQPQPFLSSEERIALDAAIADLCHDGQASGLIRADRQPRPSSTRLVS